MGCTTLVGDVVGAIDTDRTLGARVNGSTGTKVNGLKVTGLKVTGLEVGVCVVGAGVVGARVAKVATWRAVIFPKMSAK